MPVPFHANVWIASPKLPWDAWQSSPADAEKHGLAAYAVCDPRSIRALQAQCLRSEPV